MFRGLFQLSREVGPVCLILVVSCICFVVPVDSADGVQLERPVKEDSNLRGFGFALSDLFKKGTSLRLTKRNGSLDNLADLSTVLMLFSSSKESFFVYPVERCSDSWMGLSCLAISLLVGNQRVE